MRMLSYIFLFLLILIGISFATLNSNLVTVNYYVGQHDYPLSLVVICSFIAGGLAGMIVGFWMVLNAKLKVYRLKQRLKLANKEIENLRAIPLQDKH